MNVAGREDRLGFAIALLCVSFFVFASMDTIAKVLATSGIPPLQVAFMRFLLNALAVLLVLFPRYGAEIFRSNAPKLQLLRAFGLMASTVFNFFAVAYLPLTVTISIFFASPLLICLLSIPILGEKVGIRRLVSVFVGFIGVLIITQAWSADFQWAMLLSLAAMTGASTYFVMTRKVAGVDSSPVSMVYASLIPTVLVAPFGLAVWVAPDFWWQWALLVSIGLLGFVGHLILTIAYRYAQASRVAPVVYTQIIYATFFSWAIFGTLPTSTTAIGTLIIVASGVYLWWRERSLVAKALIAQPEQQPPASPAP